MKLARLRHCTRALGQLADLTTRLHSAKTDQAGSNMQKTLIRVAYITTVPVLGGAELNLLRVLPYLQREGITPVVVMAPPGGGLLERYQAAGWPTRVFHLYAKRWRSPWRYCQSMYELTAPLILKNVHLVHINHHFGLEYTTLAARLARRPCVAHVRGIETCEWVTKNLKHLQSLARLIAVSQAVKDRLTEVSTSLTRTRIIYNGIDAKRIQIINDGVAMSVHGGAALSQQDKLCENLQIAPSAVLVGLIARLEPLKGVADFLRAGAVIKRTLNNVRFIIVGTGDPAYLAELEELTYHLGIQDSVTFTGFRTDVESLLVALDVLVVATYDPLTGQGESLSNIALEAMAARTPVVARRVGGIMEILGDGRGILVDPKGIQPLVDGVLQALHMSDEERRAMTERAYDVVRGQFTLPNQARQIRVLYDEVLDGNAYR